MKKLFTAAILAASLFTASAQDAGQFFLQHEKEGIVAIKPEYKNGRARVCLFNTRNETIDSIKVQFTDVVWTTRKVSGLSPVIVNVTASDQNTKLVGLTVYRSGTVTVFGRKEVESLTMPEEMAAEAGL